MILFGKRIKKDKKKHFNVYAVLLDNKTANFNKVVEVNPKKNPRLPCVYVGMTGLDPKKRFKNHKKGYKASGWVKKYGLKLIPKLYKELNPMTYEEAIKMEQKLAKKLRKKGYTVVGGH